MSEMVDQHYLVDDQYRNGSNLRARIDLHARFSANTGNWYHWVFDHFHLPANAAVLELGCGTGLLWRENMRRIPPGWHLTLSDLSPGMLEEARRTLHEIQHPVTFAIVDAQEIPFAEDSFDAVIANHMLYHVPDVDQALAEIRRVLRPAGRCYAVTNGSAHLHELDDFLPDSAPRCFGAEYSFSLDTGCNKLARRFASVTLHRYDDSLVVIEAEPLIAYILSSSNTSALSEADRGEIIGRVEAELARHGAIHITKDSGIFEAWGIRA